MLSATSHIGLEFLTKFLNMSKLQNRLILLYQSLPLHNIPNRKQLVKSKMNEAPLLEPRPSKVLVYEVTTNKALVTTDLSFLAKDCVPARVHTKVSQEISQLYIKVVFVLGDRKQGYLGESETWSMSSLGLVLRILMFNEQCTLCTRNENYDLGSTIKIKFFKVILLLAIYLVKESLLHIDRVL